MSVPNPDLTRVVAARREAARQGACRTGPGDNFVFESLKASPPSYPDEIVGFKHPLHDLVDLYDLRALVPGDLPLVFIGGQTFAHYHHNHHSIFGMVRYSHGLVEVNVNHHLSNEFEIVMHGNRRCTRATSPCSAAQCSPDLSAICDRPHWRLRGVL
jgi:hypothetical protein